MHIWVEWSRRDTGSIWGGGVRTSSVSDAANTTASMLFPCFSKNLRTVPENHTHTHTHTG